jgi:hypothetical protein
VSAGFGRLVLDGAIVQDPYVDGLEDADHFDVISDAGPRYRVARQEPDDWDRPTWSVRRTEPAPDEDVGTLTRQGLWRSQFQYEFRRTNDRFAAGADPMIINAVFGLIGEVETPRSR